MMLIGCQIDDVNCKMNAGHLARQLDGSALNIASAPPATCSRCMTMGAHTHIIVEPLRDGTRDLDAPR